MKKLFYTIIAIIVIFFVLSIITYMNAPNIIAKIISSEFSVDVSIKSVNFSKNNLRFKDFDIGTPQGSKTSSSFFSKDIDIQSSLSQIRAKTMTIDSLTLKDNIISVEFYNANGTKNNWSKIMNTPTRPKQGSKRKYLIKKLLMYNVQVVVTQQNGITKTYPTIKKLEFNNISDETGFPIEELEKAIAHAVLRSVFQRFNLLNLLDNMRPSKIMNRLLPGTKQQTTP